MSFEFYISERERELLDALVKLKNLSDACKFIGIKKSTGSMRMRRLRDRYNRAKAFIREYEDYRRQLPTRYL